jgi:chorismate mutase
MSVEDWRAKINALDLELLCFLNQRAGLALTVGESKKDAAVHLCDHTRERDVIERMCGANRGPLDDRAVVELFRAIIHEVVDTLDELKAGRVETRILGAYQSARVPTN